MERYTKEERVIIVKIHYKNAESYAETARKLRGIYDNGVLVASTGWYGPG